MRGPDRFESLQDVNEQRPAGASLRVPAPEELSVGTGLFAKSSRSPARRTNYPFDHSRLRCTKRFQLLHVEHNSKCLRAIALVRHRTENVNYFT